MHRGTNKPTAFKPAAFRPVGSNPAFTLVELLVVIGIIALLIAILLPSLARSRQSARTVACAANLRSILQGMHQYASQNHNYFPGGPNSSGAFLLAGSYSNSNCPDISQIWDWQAPIAQVQNIAFETGPSLPQRTDRFKSLINHPAFRCPENDIIALSYSGGPGFGTCLLNSYNTASVFHYLHNPGTGNGVGVKLARTEYNVPAGYAPKITSIGEASRKIYIADGARFSTCDIPPDMDFSYDGPFGGAYADVGAWNCYSRAWDRGKAPGNPGGPIEARLFAFRHGGKLAGGPANSFRMNAGFFDGHVESLADLEAADPALWLPRGTIVTPPGSETYPDVYQQYMKNTGATYIAP